MQDVGVFQERLRRSGKADAPALHDIGVMSDAQRNVRELLDQQHANALGGKGFEHRHQPRHHDRRKTERKLVGQDVARLADDGLAEHQHLLLAAGERASARAKPRFQLRKGIQSAFDRRVQLTAIKRRAGDAQILLDGEIGKTRDALRARRPRRGGAHSPDADR